MVLPALQVRVPNPANALLQAEQIKGARAQTRTLQQQEQGRNALLTAFQGNDFRTPEGRNAIVGQVAQTAPLQALQLQQQFGQLSAQDQAMVAAEGQQTARALIGVRDQASYSQARAALGPLGQSLPEQYNPQVVQSTIQMAQSISDLTVSASTQARIAAGDRRAAQPTPPLSDVRQAQELAQIQARRGSASPTPLTGIGKINTDVANGLMTPAQGLLAAQRELAPTETWRPMTTEERAAFNIPEGQGAQISSSGKGSTLGSGGGITIFGENGKVLAQIGGGPLTNRQQGAQGIEIANEIRQTGVRLSELSTTLTSLRQNPQAAGLSGLLIENVGGVAEQISNLTGMNGDWLNTQPVQQTRTQLSSLLGQYIPTITGDTSGRYSDQDARRADAALPARRPQASFQQVESALLTLRDVELRARARALMRLDGFAPQIDITYPEGRSSYASQLLSEGKTPQEAADIIGGLMDKYEIPDAVAGIQ